MTDIRAELVDEIVARMERTFDEFTREHGHEPHVLLINPTLYDLLWEHIQRQMWRYVIPEPMYGFSRPVTRYTHRYTGVPMRFDVDTNVDVIMAMEV